MLKSLQHPSQGCASFCALEENCDQIWEKMAKSRRLTHLHFYSKYRFTSSLVEEMYLSAVDALPIKGMPDVKEIFLGKVFYIRVHLGSSCWHPWELSLETRGCEKLAPKTDRKVATCKLSKTDISKFRTTVTANYDVPSTKIYLRFNISSVRVQKQIWNLNTNTKSTLQNCSCCSCWP